MHLPSSLAVAPRLDFLPEVGSTNTELVSRASTGAAAHLSVLVTTNQTAGRGRLGRVWVAPPGRTLAVSILVTPGESRLERLGWLPLLAGLAMTRAVSTLVHGAVQGDAAPRDVALKWPNDVLIDGLKVSGLLSELVPGVGVVIGAGLNLTMTADELPTPASTSLGLAGVADPDLVDIALSGYLTQFTRLYADYADSGFDPEGSGLRAAVTRACATIGRRVRVELPGEADLIAVASGIDGSGRLLVTSEAGTRAVSAGDVTHLRYA